MSRHGSEAEDSSIKALIRPIELRRHGRFHYPEGIVYPFELVEEVGVDASYPALGIGDYRYLLQRLVGTEDQAEMIRATYYRLPPNKTKVHFGGQNSLTAGREYWVALFAEALKTRWFKSILDEAAKLAKD